MRKILAILVLGLLMSGCASYNYESVNVNYSGGKGNIVKKSGDRIYLGFTALQTTTTDPETQAIIYKGVTEPEERSRGGMWGSDLRNTFALDETNVKIAKEYCASQSKFAYFFDDFTKEDPLDENASAIYICSDQKLTKSPISGNDTVYAFSGFSKESSIYKKGVSREAKLICADLGFKIGTDKFADCTLQLYQAKINPPKIISSGSSSASSGSSTVTIHDPTRNANREIDRGMKMITGQCNDLAC